jgi:4-phospho-D-threonate 3-dehydrogenase / 4-phospho-D-erythronate 3-dehydrogenase
VSTKKTVIGITMGDLGGIGPEILFKALLNTKKINYIPVILGSLDSIQQLKLEPAFNNLNITTIKSINRTHLESGKTYFLNISEIKNKIVIGKPNPENGSLSYSYIKTGIKYALEKQIDALVTAPICKESLSLAKIPYTGHTTMLSDFCKSPNTSMGFYTAKLKTVLVTIHKPLAEVSSLLTKNNLTIAINNTLLFAKLLNIKNPRIAIAGLNPHAGEQGLFGTEEKKIIEPVLNEYKKKKIYISGPIPPDTIYYRAYHKEFDLVISLYHDQGLIPIKLLAFDKAVNITLGLPFIRTSPDHGTAFNITGKNIASPNSMTEALKLAIRLAKNKLRKGSIL